ncbi:hypothetical protein [Bdellovibrio sp. HCB337]|uniref:hypothetical protein n=1 Tax=Bdellovibrio sp. HCB337 TaxID=3394358 RepID=UPI0039A5F4A9
MSSGTIYFVKTGLILFSVIVSLLSGPRSVAADLSESFSLVYKTPLALTADEHNRLRKFQFYLVPGILSESFISKDNRSKVNFSNLTEDYFGAQENLLKQKYGLFAERLSSSSRSVEEIRINIRKALDAAKTAQKKAFFVTHSLGGLALLEELIANPKAQKDVGGILFLQSPFKGTPVADLYFEYPYLLGLWMKPVLPLVNTTEETLRYLGTRSRTQFMNENAPAIQKLVAGLPILTVGGVANGHRSLFSPSIDILETGCVKSVFSFCVTINLYAGPYSKSDGMVPFESSRLEGADFVRLEGVDHGETVVGIPFETFNKADLTLALLKLMIPKL